jgi:hypothetical protein
MARNERQSYQTHSFASRRFALNQTARRTTGMAAHRAELGQKRKIRTERTMRRAMELARLRKCDEVVSAKIKLQKRKMGPRNSTALFRTG